jgi:hypothetical protein
MISEAYLCPFKAGSWPKKLNSNCIRTYYRQTPVSAVSVIHGLLQPEKKFGELKK